MDRTGGRGGDMTSERRGHNLWKGGGHDWCEGGDTISGRGGMTEVEVGTRLVEWGHD